jgi:hypothetical protein
MRTDDLSNAAAVAKGVGEALLDEAIDADFE